MSFVRFPYTNSPVLLNSFYNQITFPFSPIFSPSNSVYSLFYIYIYIANIKYFLVTYTLLYMLVESCSLWRKEIFFSFNLTNIHYISVELCLFWLKEIFLSLNLTNVYYMSVELCPLWPKEICFSSSSY